MPEGREGAASISCPAPSVGHETTLTLSMSWGVAWVPPCGIYKEKLSST